MFHICFSFSGTLSPRPPIGALPLDPTKGPASLRPLAKIWKICGFMCEPMHSTILGTPMGSTN